jgi:hypothetical protein
MYICITTFESNLKSRQFEIKIENNRKMHGCTRNTENEQHTQGPDKNKMIIGKSMRIQ